MPDENLGVNASYKLLTFLCSVLHHAFKPISCLFVEFVEAALVLVSVGCSFGFSLFVPTCSTGHRMSCGHS